MTSHGIAWVGFCARAMAGPAESRIERMPWIGRAARLPRRTKIATKVNDVLDKAKDTVKVIEEKADKASKLALSEAQKALEKVGDHMKTHDGDVADLSEEDVERVKLAEEKLQERR